MRVVIAGLTVLLTACSGSGSVEAEATGFATGETPSAPVPPVIPKPSPATAIHIEETDRIDYELTIPAEAVALSELTAKLVSDAEQAKASTLKEQAAYAKDYPEAGNKTYGVQHNWRVVGQTDRLLSLVLDVSGYTGGAHGSAGTAPLLWDRKADREVPLASLFASKDEALATLRPQYCRALDRAREEKSGTPVVPDGTSFTECPPFSDLTVAPAGSVGGKFSRILLIADPYVAGSWAEGDYEIDLPIPKAMVPFLTPVWKPSFPG